MRKIHAILLLLAALAVVAIVLLRSPDAPVPAAPPEPAPVISVETVTVVVNATIDNAKYVEDAAAYDASRQDVSGFLTSRVNDAGKHEYFLIDDVGNSIRLEGVSSEQILLFKDPTRFYTVSGWFTSKLKGPVIAVDTIQEAERPTVEEEREI